MRLHRFIGNFDCSQDRIELSDPDIISQMINVLRLGIGDQVILGDGNAHECIGEVVEKRKGSITISVVQRHANTNEPAVAAVLYCAILKRENFELVVQKATEIGIREIVPVITKRTVKLDIKEDRLKKIIHEAAEQSGRGRLPVLHAPMQFAEALADARRNEKNFFFHISDMALGPAGSGTGMNRGLFVGPEGGWTDDEAEAARVAGCVMVSLGSLTLRAETAAIIASYLACRS